MTSPKAEVRCSTLRSLSGIWRYACVCVRVCARMCTCVCVHTLQENTRFFKKKLIRCLKNSAQVTCWTPVMTVNISWALLTDQTLYSPHFNPISLALSPVPFYRRRPADCPSTQVIWQNGNIKRRNGYVNMLITSQFWWWGYTLCYSFDSSIGLKFLKIKKENKIIFLKQLYTPCH